jgi:glutathione S-transferase
LTLYRTIGIVILLICRPNDRYKIMTIKLYVALAADGKISLKPYPQILAWCDRLKQLPGFISMPGI